MFLTQILLGAITAHYQVEGQEAYGFQLANVLPYSLSRTWHTQLAVLWIATAWLGMGLYIGPAISGHEPKFQRLGVNVLFTCLLIIVVGAFAGQWLAVMQKLGLAKNFWFGHQGWEYVDLGRFWQIFLFAGLGIWLTLVGRALWPAIKKGGENKSIIVLLFLSTVCIGLFYGAGLMWGEHTHISMVEYWRWWVVHLWVEGFFEVFATAVIAFLFTRLGLLRASSATTAVLFATIVFLGGGVLGTLHHLYFTGTPTAVIALGASFSALEVVPLAFIGFEAYHTYKLGQATPWMQRYRWPIVFFTAVAFWNVVGAGLFGFLINPPLPLYYMQGLNLTPLHGHTALFGVYGFLGIGLMLFCLRGLKPHLAWDDKVLKPRVLVLQHRSGRHGAVHAAAHRCDAARRGHRAWLLVRAVRGLHAAAHHPDAGVDARARRRHLQHRRVEHWRGSSRAVVDPAPEADRETSPLARSPRAGSIGSMIEFYPQIKWVHVAAVICSGLLFALRGGAQLAGARWTMAAPLRYLSYTIDTTLLTAALMLATILRQYPFVRGLAHGEGVVAGGVRGARQFRAEARTDRAIRLYCFLAALAVYLFIASVARAHNPLGVLTWLT